MPTFNLPPRTTSEKKSRQVEEEEEAFWKALKIINVFIIAHCGGG